MKKWQLSVLTNLFMALALCSIFWGGGAMLSVVVSLFTASWDKFWFSLAAAAGFGLLFLLTAWVGCEFDDRLRRIDGRGPVEEPIRADQLADHAAHLAAAGRPVPTDHAALLADYKARRAAVKPDPLYATWDEIIGFHTVERVLAELPESIRGDFLPPTGVVKVVRTDNGPRRYWNTDDRGMVVAEVYQFGQEKPVRTYATAEFDQSRQRANAELARAMRV